MLTPPTNLRSLPAGMLANQELIEDALSVGCIKAKIIHIKNITLGSWVRLKCQFGCPYYGKRFTCPSATPSSDEMAGILMDYEKAIVVELKSSSEVHDAVLNLENRYKQKGFYKAFALDALPCNLCEECTIDTHCMYPEKARPTLQACGIDVPQTMSNIGWNFAATLQACTEEHSVGMVLIG